MLPGGVLCTQVCVPVEVCVWVGATECMYQCQVVCVTDKGGQEGAAGPGQRQSFPGRSLPAPPEPGPGLSGAHPVDSAQTEKPGQDPDSCRELPRHPITTSFCLLVSPTHPVDLRTGWV